MENAYLRAIEADWLMESKVQIEREKTIRELFEGYDDPKLEEVDFGEPEGREVW